MSVKISSFIIVNYKLKIMRIEFCCNMFEKVKINTLKGLKGCIASCYTRMPCLGKKRNFSGFQSPKQLMPASKREVQQENEEGKVCMMMKLTWRGGVKRRQNMIILFNIKVLCIVITSLSILVGIILTITCTQWPVNIEMKVEAQNVHSTV